MQHPVLLYLLVSFFLVFAEVAFAEETVDDFGIWAPVTLQVGLPPNREEPSRVFASMQVQPRIMDNATHLNELLLWPRLGYRLNENVTLEGGAMWLAKFAPKDGGHNFKNETRLWQQVTLSRRVRPKLLLQNRTRIEERFMPGVNSMPVRGRNQLGLRYQLGKSQWYVAASDEIFVNFSSHHNGPQAGFAENRAYAGVGRQFKQNLRTEAGYQMQYVDRANAVDRLNHQLMLQVFYQIR